MTTLYFNDNDRLDTILTRVKESPDSELTLFIPEGSVFYQNEVNKKILEKIATESGKTLKLGDEKSQNEVEPGKEPEPKASKPLARPAETRKPTLLSNLKLPAVLIGIFVGFAITALAFVLLYLPKATVILFVEEKVLQKEEAIEISPDITEIALAEKKIPGKVISATEEEKKSFSATGTKVVGEKATGKVTLQNWTDEESPLISAGTKITAVEGEKGIGLCFTLDTGTTVPTRTYTKQDGAILVKPGTAPSVKVTATDIGDGYNFGAMTTFSIEGYPFSVGPDPGFSAINETAFSGGKTYDVVVVSQEDLDKAQDELKAKLLAKARDDLQSKVLGDQKLLNEVIAGDVLGVNFSHRVGEEVGSFETSLKTQSTATVYSESKLKELASRILEESVPEGYQISSKDLGTAINLIEKQAGNLIKISATFKTLVIPAFDEAKLVGELAGKRTLVAGSILDELSNIKGYHISFWPKVPTFLQILPLRSDRLTIEVETEK